MPLRALRWFRPDLTASSLGKVSAEALQKRGIDTLLVDLDNTLTHWRSGELSEEIRDWVQRARQSGMKICILSNSSRVGRVRRIAEELGVPSLPLASKPNPRGFRRAVAKVGGRPENAAVVGDQLFTDVLGGNWAGLTTIWIPPLSQEEFVFTRGMRVLERWVIGWLRRRGQWPAETAEAQAP